MMKLMQLSRPPFYTHVTQERSLSRRRYLHEVELTRSHNKMQGFINRDTERYQQNPKFE